MVIDNFDVKHKSSSATNLKIDNFNVQCEIGSDMEY